MVCICMCITELLSNCTKLEAEGSEVEEDGAVQFSKGRVTVSYFMLAAAIVVRA